MRRSSLVSQPEVQGGGLVGAAANGAAQKVGAVAKVELDRLRAENAQLKAPRKKV